MDKICISCEKPIPLRKQNRYGVKYCSPRCKYEAIRGPEADPLFQDVGASLVGTIHELVVCADLMRKGFHVFKAMSHTSPCDLIAAKGKQTLRIEVKTKPQGAIPYVPLYQREFADIIALVTYDGNIEYIPEISEETSC